MCLESVIDEVRQNPLRYRWPLFRYSSERWGLSSNPAVCASGPIEVSFLISPSFNSKRVYPPHNPLFVLYGVRFLTPGAGACV